jgi:PAS domain S-box-containing protein
MVVPVLDIARSFYMNASTLPSFSNSERPPDAEQRQPPPTDDHRSEPWFGLIRWIQENTFAPQRLPEPLRHPVIGYLAAMLIELAAVSPILLLLTPFPTFSFYPVFTLVGVVLVALGWGAGPGLLATLLSTLLLEFVVLVPHFTWTISDPADVIGLVLYLVVGVSISLLAGRSERARRQAEDTAYLLSRAEGQSRLEMQRLRTVLDVLPAAVLITSPEGQLLQTNQATRTLWGGDTALGSDVTRYPEDRLRWAQTGKPIAPEQRSLVRALSSGQTVLNEELELDALDGQRKVVLHSVAPIRDENGSTSGAVISALDISELRRLEREVAERAQELEAVFDTMTDGVFVFDAVGHITHLNAAGRRIREPDPIPVDRTLKERVTDHPVLDEKGQPLPFESIPTVRILHGEVLTGAKTADFYVPTIQGDLLAYNTGGTPLYGADGTITGAVVVTRDVTEQRRQEQHTREILGALVAMAEAMAQYRPRALAVDTLDDAATRPPSNAVLPVVARRLAELTQSVLGCRRVSISAVTAASGQLAPVTEVGLHRDQEQGWWASWSPLQRLEERYGPAIATRLYDGKPALMDTLHLPERSQHILFGAQSGRIVPMRLGEELVGTLLVDYQEPDHDYSSPGEILLTETLARLGALVLEQDRLLRGWAETRANELALAEIKVQMDTFLGIASHELKTPLTSLKLNLQVAERRLRKLTTVKDGEPDGTDLGLPSGAEQLSRATHQVERLERLVNDLVDVSRIQAGKLELRPDHVDLVEIVLDVVEMQQQAAPDRTIRFQCPPDLAVPVSADAGRIEQVVTNYLTNALKYSPADRPVDIAVEAEPEQVRVWVRDQGPGLSTEQQEHIWERFHRVIDVAVQTGGGVGLGLGLYISRMIVERHQGQVGVESSTGNGSTFWFTLPVAPPSEEQL